MFCKNRFREKVQGDTMRMRSEFENDLKENKVQFVRIRDKNINFILCQFERFMLYLYLYFEIDIEQNLYFSLILANFTLFSS